MPVLTHTGLQVPDPQFRVTALSIPPELDGALLADLHLDGVEERIGAIITGPAGLTLGVHPCYLDAFEAFAAAASRGGAPVERDLLCQLLVDEYHCALVIAAAVDGEHVARLIVGQTVATFVLLDRVPADDAGRLALAHAIARQHAQLLGRDPSATAGGTWELWTGGAWQPLGLSK